MIFFFKKLKTLFEILIKKKILKQPDFSEKRIFLNGKILASKNLEKKKIKYLGDVEFSVFSQNGEDGVIDWIIGKIPNIEKIFVEIGTEDYWESNTRFLLKSRNWKGYLFEASKQSVQAIKRQKIYWQNNITVINTFLNSENLNSELKNNIKEKNIGLLSLDVDGIDYWLLKELKVLNPRIIVCEFNTILGDIHSLTVPYDKNFNRVNKHYSNLYYGASITAIKELLNSKGYTFIGTNFNGINAYFIRNDCSDIILGSVENIKYFPSKIREGRDKNYNLTFKNNPENFNEIKHLKIYDLKTNSEKYLYEYFEIYSKEWLDKFNYI